MTPFEKQARAEVLPKMERVGTAIVEAFRRIARDSIGNGPRADLAIVYAGRRAFELTELARSCAEAEAQRICLRLQGVAIGTPPVTADRVIREMIEAVRIKLPGWTPIVILYPPEWDEAAIGSTGKIEDVRAMLLTVFAQLVGPGSADALEACAQVLRQGVSRSDIPEAL